MDPEVTTPIQQDGGAPLGAQPPADPPAPAAAQPPAPTQPAGDPKMMVVPHAQMGKIKAQAEAKGKAQALEELAAGAGFDSPTDLISALQQLKSGGGRPAQQPAAPAQQPAQPADPAADPAVDPLDPKAMQRQREENRLTAKYDRQLQKAMDERNRFANSAKDWERKARESQAQVEAAEARMAVREIAVSVGIQDLDYAERLFEREVQKLTPEQAEKFDEKAWFSGLRTKMPYLFGETTVPGNTGNAPGGAPPPAVKPGMPPPPNNGKKVSEMNRQEYQQHLRTKGINPNAV